MQWDTFWKKRILQTIFTTKEEELCTVLALVKVLHNFKHKTGIEVFNCVHPFLYNIVHRILLYRFKYLIFSGSKSQPQKYLKRHLQKEQMKQQNNELF